MTTAIQNFSSEQTWLGGFYEIEFELGVPSDERLALALQTVWSYPSLEGCYLSREREPHTQTRVNPRDHANEGHLYGIANLPNGAKAACGTYVCRLQDEAGTTLRDLLAFYVPHGALARTYQVGGYPFSDADRAATWRVPLDEWLVDLGRSVHKQVPFGLALIGFEVDFPNVSAETVQQNGIPTQRFDGYLWHVAERLEWHPPTNLNLIRFSEESK
jgi:hypothetical protein